MANLYDQWQQQWRITVKNKINTINRETCKDTKLRLVRALYLFINNTRYQMCSFDPQTLKIWKTTERKKHELIEQLYTDYTKKGDIPFCDVKRISMLIATLKKFENP
jgi:hypothetical protein